MLDLNQRLRETSKLLRPLMGDDVEIVIVNRAPSSLVEADPVQLDQVVLNLAVNARDAMAKGGKLILETSIVNLDEELAAQHSPLQVGKYVLLAVSDTGSGMDQVTAGRIFEPFFHDQGNRKRYGTRARRCLWHRSTERWTHSRI